MNPKRYPLSAMMLLVVFVTHFSALHQTCSACDLATETSCQAYDGFGESAISDLGYGLLVADDFIPLGDTMNSICIWGTYVNGQGLPAPQCADLVVDSFNIAVYSNSSVDDLPESTIGRVGATINRTSVTNTDTFEYQLLLDEPIGGLLLDGRKYWIEVANDLWEYPDCNWAWSQVNPINPGNQHSAQGNWGIYNVISAQTKDQAFCLNIDFTTPEVPIKPCCTCVDGVCTMTTLKDCQTVNGQWHIDAGDCIEITCTAGPPTNDSCENAIAINNTGLEEPFITNNYCATTDGYNPVLTELGEDTLANDLWFTITPKFDVLLSAYMCDTFFSYDSMLAVYTNGTSVCTCPTDEATHVQSFKKASDNCCYENVDGGSGFIDIEIVKNTCYLLRVGGAALSNGRGVGLLKVSLSFTEFGISPPLPNPAGPGTQACGGGFQYGLPVEICDAGTRISQLCIDSNDCPGGNCVPDYTICPDAFCGLAVTISGIVNSPYPKSRFIGFSVPAEWIGVDVAVRVKLINVKNHPECSDQSRWVGPPVEYCESSDCTETFIASSLQDTPFFTDWTLHGVVQIVGEEIIPQSRYALQAIDVFSHGNPENEFFFSSPPLIIDTGKWGDVVAPFHGFTSSSQPTIADVLAIVDKWLGALEPRKPRTQLQPQIPNPNLGVGIADVLQAVDAWLGAPYPYPIDSCSP